MLGHNLAALRGQMNLAFANPKAKKGNEPLVNTDTNIPPDFGEDSETVVADYHLSSRVSLGAQAEGIPSWPAASARLEEATEVPTAEDCPYPISELERESKESISIEQRVAYDLKFMKKGQEEIERRGKLESIERDEEHDRANSPQLQVGLPNSRSILGRNGAPSIQLGSPCHRVRGHGT